MKTIFFRKRVWWGTAVFLLIIIAACTGQTEPAVPQESAVGSAAAGQYDQYEMVTLLPRDAIPAIDNPEFYTAAEADDYYAPDELVIGVEFNGDARAYSVPFLSGHEIVNDTVGGRKIAVTW